MNNRKVTSGRRVHLVPVMRTRQTSLGAVKEFVRFSRTHKFFRGQPNQLVRTTCETDFHKTDHIHTEEEKTIRRLLHLHNYPKVNEDILEPSEVKELKERLRVIMLHLPEEQEAV